MSDSLAGYKERLDTVELTARIECQQAEIGKLIAEGDKLRAEAAKLDRYRFLAPFVIGFATLTAMAVLMPVIIHAVWG